MSVFEWYQQNPRRGAIFNGAMGDHSRAQIDALLAAYDFSGISHLVDVGGGVGGGGEATGPLEAETGFPQLLLDRRAFRLHQIHQHHLAAWPKAAGQGGEKGQLAAIVGKGLKHKHGQGAIEAGPGLKAFHAGLLPVDAGLPRQPCAGQGEHGGGGIQSGELPVGTLGAGLQQLGSAAAARHQHGGALGGSKG